MGQAEWGAVCVLGFTQESGVKVGGWGRACALAGGCRGDVKQPRASSLHSGLQLLSGRGERQEKETRYMVMAGGPRKDGTYGTSSRVSDKRGREVGMSGIQSCPLGPRTLELGSVFFSEM